MSLLRLLTAGKCLMDLKESTFRYRMTDPRALPKFGPVHAERKSAVAPECAPPEGTAPEPMAGAEPAQVGAPEPEPQVAPPAEGSAPVAGQISSKLVLRTDGHWRRPLLGAFAWAKRWLSGRPSPARRLAASSSGQPVQAELALDKVQVVRNDFSDADQETVSLKAQAEPPTSTGTQKIEPAEPAWGGNPTQTVGAGET
ncbi:hypothetical protein SBV1_1710019 [Verrucomicrobia bacterium]|nr:hypothetical protein SBV1_1710019 [Verrucomicrobiota bacterium]